MLNSQIAAAGRQIVQELNDKYPDHHLHMTEHYTTDDRFVVLEFHFVKHADEGSFALVSYTTGNNMRKYEEMLSTVEDQFCRFYSIRLRA